MLGYDAKDVVGSQRFGFVSLAAFALLFFFPVKSRLQKTARIGGMVLLFVGIMLTFSRASIVTLLLGSALYFIYALFQWIRRPGLKYFVKGITGVLGTFAVIILLAYLFPFVFEFFNERIFERWFFGGGGADILNPETSEGIRLEILRHILTYVLENPLTGSGYLGPWILTVIDAGSAHNQYTDILFRTGFIGFAGYLYLEYRLLRFLWSQYRDLFWGFIGILIYGFFHETFKESQGAFLLAFLIGMNESYLRSFSKAKTMTCGHIKSDVTTARTL
ncbi:MAG: O-antigen ligase family protein [Cytophaga sp.]|nr:O-antigen ligase family protein [Undibacterium sp.]